MDSFQSPSLPPRELIAAAWSQRRLWISTTAACGLLAAAYALVTPRYWEASQGLVVRQETAGSTSTRPGKFADLFEMRTLQETILEVAKSQEVIKTTLANVSREFDGPDADPPSLEDLDEFRKRLKMLPPDGGEFGKTEVFYFVLRAKSRERAMRLVGELCVQTEAALKNLRAERATSLIAELEEQARMAAELLAAETKRLIEFETSIGGDLGELRMLHSANSGQSDLRMEAVQLEAEVRKFRTQTREGEKLIALLKAAQEDPRELIATPNSLLTSQPALRRLKDGLIDSQLATSRLGGTRSSEHPRVRAAIEAEQQIRVDLHNELLTAIRGAEVELQLSRDRLTAAQDRLTNLQTRFTHLAELRAEYSNRVAAVENCRMTLDRARQDLSTGRAAHASAHSGTLVTRLDKPETGPYPAGPGRTVITAAGAMAGLMLGLGLVFLKATPAAPAPHTRADIRQNIETPASHAVEQPARGSVAASSETIDPAPAPLPIPLAVAPASPPTPAPAPVPVTPVTAAREQMEPAPTRPRSEAPIAPRKRRETLPTPAGVLPLAGQSSPLGSSGYSGMTLQEALQAAARQASL